MDSHDLKFYDQLLQFRLFQGMSRSELLQMAGNTRFGFQKLAAGKWVVREGDACQQLLFLVGGTLSLSTRSDDHSYTYVEELSAPWLLQPEALFGLSPRYSCDVRTLSDCHFFTLSKDEVLRLLDDFLIFRLNLLNAFATNAQRVWHKQWLRSPQTLEQRIVRFFTDHAVYPAGRKEVHILMKQLAIELADTRLNVSRVLNQLQDRQLLELRRGSIHIPSLERLLM
ncbi:MAG: Crp/Fnr family transcriptional regulator [Prevotella sp.]|nr:Crp/Fnr family transcriptional regulator [Prevotella sp.]